MASRRYKDTHSVRISLYDYPHNRTEGTSKDAYFKNCYPERYIGGQLNSQEANRYYLTKRPGLGTATHAHASGTGRGMYIWQNNLYYVIGSDLYKNGTDIGNLNAGTNMCYFEIMGGGSTSEKLIIVDNQNVFSVESDDTVTQHAVGGEEPEAQIGTVAGGVANLDGYLFICDTDGKILHNDDQNETAANVDWGDASIISANVYADQLKGIVRHLNYIVAIGEWSTEFFYNAGNTTGSVLDRAEGTVIRYGTANFDTVWQDENIVVWVARSRDGGHVVLTLDGLTPKIVSTKPIERILNEESDITDAYAYGIRIEGHIFYILNLPNADKTLVFSLTDNMWSEWTTQESATEKMWQMVSMRGDVNSSGATVFYGLHVSNGDVYPFDPDNYQDNSEDIKVKVVTDKIDFGTNQIKQLYRLYLLGDRTTASSTVSLRWTDDDYQNWSNSYDSDLQYTPQWGPLGSFSRRAFELTHEDNQPLRWEALECILRVGSFAQGRL